MTGVAAPTPHRRRLRRRSVHAAGGILATLWVAAGLALLVPRHLTGAQRLSLVFAYTSLAALLVTLSIGAINVLTGRRNPLSTDVRRDAGLVAATTGFAHVGISLTNHFGGDVALYFFERRPFGLRSIRADTFGLGSWSGLVATIFLVALSLTSNDRAIRRLGRSRWKRVQRSNYALCSLTIGHTVLFWLALDRTVVVVGLVGAAATTVLALQLGGVRRTTRSRQRVTSRLG